MEDRITLGEHALRYEPPDLLFLDWRGTLEASDIETLSSFTETARERSGAPLYLVVDARAARGISGAARKGVSNLARRKYWHATLCHGADFKLRVLIELIVNAVNLLVKEPLPLVFVGSEAEARDWVRARREAGAA